MAYTAHIDTFARDHLPPRSEWPELIFTLPELQYPERLNCATELLDKMAAQHPERPCVRAVGLTWTYGELLEQANRMARVLVEDLGLVPGNRVLLRAPNNPMLVAAWFAVMKAGGIAVTTMPLLRARELTDVVTKAAVSHALCDGRLREELEHARSNCPTLQQVVYWGEGGSLEARMAHKPTHFANVETASDDTCLIAFTSGTTGQPKGCVHFVREVFIEAQLVNKYVWKLQPGDVMGGSAPVSFAAGYGTFCIIPFAGGAAISLLPKFTPDDMLATIQKHKVTVVTGLPTAYRKLLEMPNFDQYDLSSVRMYTTGGDALTGKTLSQWMAKTGKPIWEGLGGTEMLHLVTSNAVGDVPIADSIGKAIPGFQIKVVREDGTDAGPGEVGSMLIKGPTGTLYWKPYVQDERLLKAMKKGVKDGWNMLGDAVVMDKDGYIFFQAREDDMIKSSGFRLAPQEIEDAIMRHPAVRDVAVVGIPDEILGQKVVAMVELESGYSPSQELASEIIKSTMDLLATYKLPREVVFLTSIPRTPTGKIIKKDLRKHYPEYTVKFVPKVK